jgi:hypothetical protein
LTSVYYNFFVFNLLIYYLTHVGDFPAALGDFPAALGDFPAALGDFPADLGDFLFDRVTFRGLGYLATSPTFSKNL